MVYNNSWYEWEYNSYQIGEAVMEIGGLEVALSQSMSAWLQWWSHIVRDGSFLQQNITCFGLSNSTCKGKSLLNDNAKVGIHFNLHLVLGTVFLYQLLFG